MSATASSQTPATADTAAWIQDFRQLQHEMASHYANLDWARQVRGLDLVALSDTATARIRRAQTDDDAKRAIEGFIRAFGDGHFEVRWPSPPRRSSGASPASTQPAGVCGKLGYTQKTPTQRIDFASLKQYRKLDTPDNRYFPIGILEIDKKKFGLLRISSFEDNVFADLCTGVAARLRISPDSNCADGCAGPLDRETANEMTAAVERQLNVLKSNGIKSLIVDITNNGGGTNWVESVARVVTSKPLHAPRVGFVRHTHYVEQYEEQLASLRRDSASASGPARDLINRAITTFRNASNAARQQCDRDSVWVGKAIACSLVVLEIPLYTTGILDYAKPGSVPKIETCCPIYYPARYEFHEGVYSGPLIVLVDRGTASAAEYFAAVLADNGAAVIAGEPTFGAGCGYTNGGIAATLAHSKGRVVMPDCVRLRRDGTNEVEGITPDVLIPWRPNDTPLQRARRLIEVMPWHKGARASREW